MSSNLQTLLQQYIAWNGHNYRLRDSRLGTSRHAQEDDQLPCRQSSVRFVDNHARFVMHMFGNEGVRFEKRELQPSSGRLPQVLVDKLQERGTPPGPTVCGRWSDLICSDRTRSGRERVQVGCA